MKINEVITAVIEAATAGSNEPMMLGGRKLDPRYPNDARVIAALQSQQAAQTPSPTQEPTQSPAQVNGPATAAKIAPAVGRQGVGAKFSKAAQAPAQAPPQPAKAPPQPAKAPPIPVQTPVPAQTPAAQPAQTLAQPAPAPVQSQPAKEPAVPVQTPASTQAPVAQPAQVNTPTVSAKVTPAAGKQGIGKKFTKATQAQAQPAKSSAAQPAPKAPKKTIPDRITGAGNKVAGAISGFTQAVQRGVQPQGGATMPSAFSKTPSGPTVSSGPVTQPVGNITQSFTYQQNQWVNTNTGKPVTDPNLISALTSQSK